MPRPAASGYERLAQDAELSDSEDDLQSIISHPGRIASALTGGVREPSGYRDGRIGMRRNRSNSSGVDIKAINARLERWAEEIANKFKIGKNKGKLQHEEAALEIVYSVFVPLEGLRPITDLSQVDQVETDDNSRLNKEKFDEIVESVRIAIGKGIDPLLITQGSSGSYFARNTDGKIVGVMKPKDEEP